MKRTILTFISLATLLTAVGPANAEDSVIVPSELELNDEQKADLKSMLDKKLTAVVKECVGQHPRPEFFTSVTMQFDLRKTGELRGGYVPGGAVDSNMYVKSDEERDKLKEDGSFARIVVRADRDLERCFKKGTKSFDTDFDRISAKVGAVYKVTWTGKQPKVEAGTFEVTKG